MPRDYKRRDRTGDRVGRLLVIKELDKNDKGRWNWLCLCDCGKEHVVNVCALSDKSIQSCGCAKKEKARDLCLSREKHGYSKRGNCSKEYRTWANIKQRTSNPKRKDFERYGAIGRVMSDALFNDFELFLKEVGECPKDGRKWSIGRIDNNLGYVEGNLRWETEDQQQRNRMRQRNNTTGLGGVYRHYARGILHYVADWWELDGTRRTKTFSTRKYGEEGALILAKEYRMQMITKLNEQGAGYSNNHGK